MINEYNIFSLASTHVFSTLALYGFVLFNNIGHVNHQLLFFLSIHWNLLYWRQSMKVWSYCHHTIILSSNQAYIISTVRDFILPTSHLHHGFLVRDGSIFNPILSYCPNNLQIQVWTLLSQMRHVEKTASSNHADLVIFILTFWSPVN